jgi:hypothetical protein
MGYYIVDTNIIINYMKNEDNLLVEFINRPENKFFYTNTVLEEILLKNDQQSIPNVFEYVDSNVSSRKINFVLSDIQKSIGLTEIQLRNFRNDLSIILEAGYICYDVTPDDDYKGACLLTHNLKLYKKFISNPVNQEKLEIEINLHGLEHLIEVVTLEDVLYREKPIELGFLPRAQPQGRAEPLLARVGMQSIPPRFPSENVLCPEGQGRAQATSQKTGFRAGEILEDIQIEIQ